MNINFYILMCIIVAQTVYAGVVTVTRTIIAFPTTTVTIGGENRTGQTGTSTTTTNVTTTPPLTASSAISSYLSSISSDLSTETETSTTSESTFSMPKITTTRNSNSGAESSDINFGVMIVAFLATIMFLL